MTLHDSQPENESGLQKEERRKHPCGWIDPGKKRDVVRERRPSPMRRQEGADPAIREAPRREQQDAGDD
jgi:hypothetical protein